VPRVEVRPLAHKPAYLLGLLDHGGRLVPVIDLNVLLGGAASPPRLGTRILLARVGLPGQGQAVLGLLGEGMDRLLDHAPDPRPPGERRPAGRFLGRVLKWGDLVAQEVDVDLLLPDDLRDDLYVSTLGHAP
jgi:chemotaxis-related protein WspB